MINHLRTLLVNRDSSFEASTLPGGAFVPPEFAPLTLPFHLAKVREKLFSPLPDGWMVNYRLAQVLGVVRSTRFAQYEFAYDERVTYAVDPLHGPIDLLSTGFGTTVVAADEATAASKVVPSLVGEFSTETRDGKLRWEWLVRVTAKSDDEVAIIANRVRPSLATLEAVVPFVNGLSEPVLLPGNGTALVFPATCVAGQSWMVTALLRPALGVVDAVAGIAVAGERVLAPLFDGVGEPHTTFINLWRSERFSHRLCGLIFAYQAKADAVWRARDVV